MTIDVDARNGPLATAVEHPVLVVASALLIFSGLLVASTFFGAIERTTAVIEVTRIELDREANDPAALIRTAPFVVDVERDTILSDSLIKDALATVSLGADVTDFLATRSPFQRIVASFSLPTKDDERLIDTVLASNAVRKNLTVSAGAENDRLDISLSSTNSGGNDDMVDMVNAVAAAYVGLRNQERKQQKAQALGWADKKLAHWQAAVDASRTAVFGDQSNSVALDAIAGTHGKQLINLLINATKAAQASSLTEMKNVLNPTGQPSQRRNIDVLEKEYAELELEIERLAIVSFEADQAPEQEQTTSPDLEKSEEGLALFRQELDALISSGFLDSPAATFRSPASTTSFWPFSYWAVAVPLAAAVSILLALALTMIIERMQQQGIAGDHPDAALDTDIESILSNPHWPMTPEQRRQSQAPPIELS